MPHDLRPLAAKILAHCIEAKLERQVFGIFAEHLPAIDVISFVNALTPRTEAGKARVSVLGLTGSELGAVRQACTSPNVTFDPEMANRWRNDEAARSVPQIVLVVGPAPKVNSLRTAYTLLGHRDLREHIARLGYDLLRTYERKVFWDVVVTRED